MGASRNIVSSLINREAYCILEMLVKLIVTAEEKKSTWLLFIVTAKRLMWFLAALRESTFTNHRK